MDENRNDARVLVVVGLLSCTLSPAGARVPAQARERAMGEGRGMERRQARWDPGLIVRRIGQQRLYYRAGADGELDRPRQVRAASGLAWMQGRLAIVQDDAHFVGLWHPGTAAVESIPLPRGPGGLRLFDSSRHNKHEKLDLEAAAAYRGSGGDSVVVFGSGSSARRETILRLTWSSGAESPRVRTDDAPRFYGALRAQAAFAGSELNIEGAAILADRTLRLFQRGNGAPRGDVQPVNATIDIRFPELEAWLDGSRSELPPLENIVSYDLGEVGGVRLSFTDATATPSGSVLFLASAEDSPDAIEDGPVIASAVGIIGPSGDTRYGLLEDESGRPLPLKIEGVALDPDRHDRIYLVTDPDDATAPATLVTATLRGPWW